MKKTTIHILATATLALASCVREQELPVNPRPILEYTLEFSVTEGTPEPRSKAPAGKCTRGNVIDLGKTPDGKPFRFEEWTSSPGIPADSLLTKGSPATSDNVSSLYGSYSAVAYDGTSPVTLDGQTEFEFSYRSESGRWAHVFECNPWASHSELYFFMWMPDKPAGTTFDPSLHTLSFSYTTPLDAADQKDLLFGGCATTKTAFDADMADNTIDGFTVQFHHALSGVKFVIGNDANNTVIKQIVLKGIVKTGSCVITPGASTPADWTPGSATADYTIDNPGVVEIGGQKNLNDDDLSYTLWLIPQTLSDDAELEVTYSINGGSDTTVSARINEALGGALSLAAGELHTFTLNQNEVNVTITDTVSSSELNSVVITNTGNAAAYLRAVIVANWQDADGNIVAAWDYVPAEFEGLPGSGWVLNAEDQYYYTTSTIAAGEDAPALFTSYTPPSPPVTGAHLVMDIAVQAVKTKPASWAD